jgi:hypothetical protein
VVDIGLDHRRVYAHPPSRGHAIVLGYSDHAFVDLLEHFRPECQAPTAHGLGIRRLSTTDTGEVPVHQVGPHLALQHVIAPVAHVFEDQESQHCLGRHTAPAAATAVGMPLRQGFVYRRDDLFVGQHLVGVTHPVFMEIAHLTSNQSITEAELSAPHLNHASSSHPWRQLLPVAAGRD